MRYLSLSFAALAATIIYVPVPKGLSGSSREAFAAKRPEKRLVNAENAFSGFRVSIVPSVRQTISKNKLNEQVCFIINMAIPSGKKRLFIYNIKKDSIEASGLVTHGMGNGEEMQFSNTPGSKCTSLGNYKVGYAYTGEYGLAYRLYGLDSSNSNAYRRCIVLHGLDCVPDYEVYPRKICLSMGCPMVSPIFLQRLSGVIDNASKPILLMVVNKF